MASLTDAGHWYPALLTLALVGVLSSWCLYALSGAGVIPKLPLLKPVLILIAAVLILRGLAFVFLMPAFPENSLTFWLISSGICLALGLLYARGAWTFIS